MDTSTSIFMPMTDLFHLYHQNTCYCFLLLFYFVLDWFILFTTTYRGTNPLFLKKIILMTGTNIWLPHNDYFCWVAHASSYLSGRHTFVLRSHIDSFIIVIILKPMQHNSVKKLRNKLINSFALTFSLTAHNKWDRKGKHFTTYRKLSRLVKFL